MNYVRSLAWAILTTGWVAAFFFIGARIGGIQWIAHTGQSVPAALDLLMAGLCLIAALIAFSGRRIPGFVSIPTFLVALLHLVNVLTLVMLADRAYGAALVPLVLLSAVVPTNTMFVSLIPGYSTLLMLPVLSLVLPFFPGRESVKKVPADA